MEWEASCLGVDRADVRTCRWQKLHGATRLKNRRRVKEGTIKQGRASELRCLLGWRGFFKFWFSFFSFGSALVRSSFLVSRWSSSSNYTHSPFHFCWLRFYLLVSARLCCWPYNYPFSIYGRVVTCALNNFWSVDERFPPFNRANYQLSLGKLILNAAEGGGK